MKREHLILTIFLGLVIVSGAVIYVVQSSASRAAARVQADSSPEAQFQMPPGPDSVTIMKQIAQLERQLKQDPDDYEALVGLGNSYYDLNDPAEAIKYYEKVLKMRPDEPAVLVDCGAMYRQSGNPDKALEMFRKAIEIDPNLPQAYFNLGMVLAMEKKNPVEAAKAWKKYLELEPNSEAREFLQAQIDRALRGK